jgi:hypothetical protein
MRKLPRASLARLLFLSIYNVAFAKQSHPFATKRLKSPFGVIHHDRHRWFAMRANDQRIGLDDVDFSLQKSRADGQEWLVSFGEFNTNQIAFDDRQPSSFEYLPPAFGLIDKATIRIPVFSKRRTTSRSCPTRFSKKTVN